MSDSSRPHLYTAARVRTAARLFRRTIRHKPTVSEDQVQIGRFLFTLVSKKIGRKVNSKHIVKVCCNDGGVQTYFFVYNSYSELQTWRLCFWKGNTFYKGNSKGKYYDYSQQTLVHADLQDLLNSRFEFLKEDGTIDCAQLSDMTEKEVNNMLRPMLVEPFYTFFKKQEEIDLKYPGKHFSNRCGNIWNEHHRKELKELSHSLEEKYTLTSCNFKYKVLSENIKLDTRTYANFMYYVYVAKLLSKTKLSRPLYLLYAKVIHYECDDEVYGPFEVENVYFPLALTLTQACNSYGCYIDYVVAGRYMCKFLEYKDQWKVVNEEFPQISSDINNYVYTASIYQNLFPYTQFHNFE
jgi:hypothetical protein